MLSLQILILSQGHPVTIFTVFPLLPLLQFPSRVNTVPPNTKSILYSFGPHVCSYATVLRLLLVIIGSYAVGTSEQVSVSADRYGDIRPTKGALSKAVAITHLKLGSSVLSSVMNLQ